MHSCCLKFHTKLNFFIELQLFVLGATFLLGHSVVAVHYYSDILWYTLISQVVIYQICSAEKLGDNYFSRYDHLF